MEINSELLKKYARGLCTEQERLQVEAWLSSSDEGIDLPSKEKLADAKSKMWAAISPSLSENTPRIIPLYKKIIHYSAAACLLITFSGSLYFFLSRNVASEIAVENIEGKIPKQIQLAGIELKLLPSSKANVESNLCGSNRIINFCGNMEITNNTGKAMEVEIISSCAFSPYTSRKRQLRGEKKYFVFHNKYKYDEVYVMDINEINDLPRPLAHKVKTLFNI